MGVILATVAIISLVSKLIMEGCNNLENTMENRIRRIVAHQLEMNVDYVEMDSELIELGADSLDLIEIHTDVEYEFDIEIPDEEFEQAQTVKDIVQCAERVRKARTETGEDER